jgi:cell shape-determining protein MreD
MVGLGALVSMRFTGYLIDRYGGVVLPVAVFLFALCGVLPALADSAITLQRRFEPALLVFGVLCALSFVVENAWQSWGAVHLDTTYNAALPSPPALRRSSPRPQPPEGSVATHS